jgi:PST family polysaccharide transporter
LPFFGIGLILIFFLKEQVIYITHGEEFIGMKPLFKWQLLADFIKIASIIIAHQFLAKKMIKQFIFTELISLLIFYGLSMCFIRNMGAEGVVIAHFIRYILYFLMVILVLRKHIFGNNKL